MNLLNEFKRHLSEGRFFDSRNRILVAVSTGVDSMTLVDLIQRLPRKQRPFIMVAHVNHHLRKQSSQEEHFLRQYCQQHELPLAVHQWQPAEHPQTGIETAARDMRYRFFAEVMGDNKLDTLVTAHHGDDLAETMLMKLTRGGQLNQLIGIADQRAFHNGRLVRPLLPFSKDTLVNYARHRNLHWYEDVTNLDLGIQRNRYRHEIIPLLKKENPQFLRHLYRYHQQLLDAVDLNEHLITERLTTMVNRAGQLELNNFATESPHFQKWILRRWLEQFPVRDLKQAQIGEIVTSLANPQKPHLVIDLPHHFQLIKDYTTVSVQKKNKVSGQPHSLSDSVVKFEHWYSLNADHQLAVAMELGFFANEQDKVMEMWLPKKQFPLRLRQWRPGDELRLRGGNHQAVRRILIDQKVPVAIRSQQKVLTLADGQILTLVGYKWSWFDRPADYLQQWVHFYVGQRHQKGEKNE
ncbi:tRNA(Ile)-lysidine synthetase [Limosilactobacillus frumenti DSM 13145]|uniref:tRNA(Ile)-lysidine synthase n=1 Tax=Limosilactobacillus frumenti DSM 13145 TaxID=1423746 RepID=A0A0R1P915_9LACO|nr:tRNA lysidine(34) synthetase TilS [Limosilactobacillus frumenti]KRL28764.1 tRNA(Ile)-lysidine synthetase [Limosilactobacillus frumenti DSM 13145]MBA2914706.1 tRNA lysidine(34) synthetase TilS [Limosilactobacillus frumenti]QFG72101.1 tRNA lysidine(34) synthetase TilS [Limosilactobacillus frumenti]